MLELEFTTIEEWDEALWARIERIYHEAFQSGAKTKAILHSMLDRKLVIYTRACIMEKWLRWLLLDWRGRLRTAS
ncbi:hypothetical protein [Paenibacillus amylolyticus]|uniref:hypothetical protein n=1 Tax=Paenibacillus amylolyticus TaxID=1451 RepID=UPI00344EB003